MRGAQIFRRDCVREPALVLRRPLCHREQREAHRAPLERGEGLQEIKGALHWPHLPVDADCRKSRIDGAGVLTLEECVDVERSDGRVEVSGRREKARVRDEARVGHAELKELLARRRARTHDVGGLEDVRVTSP
jgi:hypothetical protein